MADRGIRAVSFDAGSTLIHWFAYTPDRFGLVCARAGIAVPRARFHDAARAGERFRQAHPVPDDCPDADWWRRYNMAALAAAGVGGTSGPWPTACRQQCGRCHRGGYWIRLCRRC